MEGWKVLPWYARADEDLKKTVYSVTDEERQTVIVSTDGLGAGMTYLPFRTVISSCQSNRPINVRMMGVVPNSKEAVQQEGGRVGRDQFLGVGRHI